MEMMWISIIVPVLNEAQGISESLAALAPLRARGHEVIVVDGGSSDKTPDLRAGRAAPAAPAPRTKTTGGGARPRGEVLVFLHADTRLPEDAGARILQGLAASGRA